ncbi:MAG: sulfatase-like hydrolase/transferase, partial [Pseudomonadota bacterium]
RDVGDAPLPTEYGFDESYVSFEGLGDRVLFGNGRNASASEKLGRGKIDHAPKHQTTRIYTDKSIDFISRHREQPFYLELFPNDVHDGFLPADGQAEKFAKLTDNPEEQKFLAVLTEMDRQIGRLLKHLETTGLAKRTIVIFTSDNGPTDWPRYYERGIDPPGFTGPFFGRKWSLYEGGIRMPFIIRWPGRVPSGRTDDNSVVAAFDLQPTVAKLTGISTPKGKVYDGLDRSSVLLGNPSGRSQPVCWEYGVLGSISPGKKEHKSPGLAMRLGDWKLLCQPDGSEPKLFNLKQDPSERNNLTGRDPDRTKKMTAKLTSWWKQMQRNYLRTAR